MSPLEIIAFTVSIVGVWLTARRSVWNFPFSMASVALYAIVFFEVRLYADALLQIIFALTLAYGWVQWARARDARGIVRIGRITTGEVLVGIIAGVVSVALFGTLLARFTDAALPWIDSALLAASLVATVWAARRKLESWWMWIVVDIAYVGVYVVKALYLTAVLYALFVGLAFWGWRLWTLGLREQASAAAMRGATPA